MVLNNIEDLLEKYDNGETTLKEEQQLKDYFSQETVAPHLEHYKPMFNYFLVNQQEQFTKDIPLKTKRKFNYKWLSVAAVAVLMFGIYIKSGVDNELKPTAEERLAFNKAMGLMSKAFNKSKAQVNYLSVMDKAGTQVDYLKEMENPIGRVVSIKH